MYTSIRRFFSSKDLIYSWTSRTIRGRYQQSALGWLWAIIQPAASVAIFAFIFTLIVPVETDGTPYIIFSYVAMVPWTLFSSAITDMADSLVQNMTLVTKIYFPREAIPLAMMMARLFDFGIASILLVILLIYFQIPFFPLGLIYIPIILAVQLMLIAGLGLAFAAINVFFRDIQPLLKLLIQILFYACPIIYPVSLVPENLTTIFYLNPVAGIIASYRDVILDGKVPGEYLIFAGVSSALIFLLGFWIFKRVEFKFADFV